MNKEGSQIDGDGRGFGLQFEKLSNWKPQPLLHDNPRLIGNFQKNDVFVEIQ